MKKHFVSVVLVCAMLLFGAGMSFAGQGNGAGDGTGPIHDILSGVPFKFEGVVAGCEQGGGLTLTTDGGDEVLYGIGPVSYWEKMGVDHPVLLDQLIASGFTVNYNGVERNVVMSITIEEMTIDLRDPVTGKPLWRGSNKPASAGSASYGNSGNFSSAGGQAGSGGSASPGASKGGAYK